jgi:tetratricopeptide (TPR) repeat protein
VIAGPLFKVRRIFYQNQQNVITIRMRQCGHSALIILCLSFSFEVESQKMFFPDNYANYRWKGDSLFRLKNFEQALSFYKKALSEPSKDRFKRYCYYNSSFVTLI